MIDDFVDALETRLTAARAGYLDNLSAGAVALEATAQSILTDTAEIGTAGAGLTALATQASVNTIDDFLDTEVAAIKAKTDNLPAAPAATGDCITAAGVRTAGGLASANLDTQLDALPTAAEIFAATLTTQLTEAYAADGTAPTLAQAIFLIQQSLHEFAIAGTTRTVKKLDGTTTAATFTLDSSTAPTSTTRAS